MDRNYHRRRSSQSITEATVLHLQNNPRHRLLLAATICLLLFYTARVHSGDHRAASQLSGDDETGPVSRVADSHHDWWFDGVMGGADRGTRQRQRPAPEEDTALPRLPSDPRQVVIATGPGVRANNAPVEEPFLTKGDGFGTGSDAQEGDGDEDEDETMDQDERPFDSAALVDGYESRFDKFAIALKSGVDVVHQRSLIQLMTYLKPVRNLVLIGDGTAQVGDRVMIDVIGDTYGRREEDPILNGKGPQPRRSAKAGTGDAVAPDEGSQGWKADGHKNLPGFRELYRRFPDAEWYLMIDDDTYVFLDNLSDRLSMYDPDGKHYFGAKTQFVGCDGVRQWGAGPYFAHGGSGIVLSRGAAREMMDGMDGKNGCIEKYKTCWAGDIRTSLCLRDQGILLHSPTGFFSTPPNRDFWFPHEPCDRPLTFHHLLVKQIQELYSTERTIANRVGKGSVTFGDIYWAWHPETEWQPDFDRKGGDYAASACPSPEACKDMCLDRKNCLAYVFDGSKCWLKDRIPGGIAGKGMTSGVLRERYICNTNRKGV
ncbi:hypothetical protein HKX48_007696 [Thoreauomyces humboldtii]|nr:hypothetical protein HKX48_007696 [Thoreauomyces humboldtii]